MKTFLLFILFCFVYSTSLRAAPENAWRIPPFFWHQENPIEKEKFSMAFLLYWDIQNQKDHLRLWAPFYYDSSTPEEKLRILLPFHFYSERGDSKTQLSIPYFHKENSKTTTNLIFPLLFRQETELYDTGVLFPLYWTYQSKEEDGTSFDLFFPLYLSLYTQRSQSFFSPLGWSSSNDNLSQGLFLTYYWRHSLGKQTDIGFPIYWRFRKMAADGKRDIQIAPPWFKYETPKNSFRTFLPLYWGWKIESNSSEGSVLFPFYVRSARADGRKKFITPLYSHFQDPDGTTYGHLGPAFFMEERWGGKLKGIFPLGFYREEVDFYKFRFLNLSFYKDAPNEHRKFSFFPLIRYQRDFDRARWLTPLFFTDKDPDSSRGFFLSYLWRTEYLGEGPARKLITRNRVFLPFWWSLRSEDETLKLFFPFYVFHKEATTQTSSFFPFYMRKESPERRWESTFLLFWKTQKDKKKITFLIPFFRKASFPNGNSLLLPNFYYLKDTLGTQGFFLPYLWDHRGKTQYELLPPLYANITSPNWKVKSIFPYYAWQTLHIKETGLFPFWANTKPMDTDVSDSSLNEIEEFFVNSHRFLPFYFYRKTKTGSDLWLPILLSRLETEINSLGNISFRRRFLLGYWEKTPSQAIQRLDPLFVHYKTPAKKGFAIPTAPFSLWRYEKEETPREGAKVSGSFFPYIWKRSKTEKKDIFFPLYYRKQKIKEDSLEELSRTTWFLIYYSQENREENAGKKFILPFYCHFQDPEKKTSLFIPFWWHQTKEQESASLFFPFYFRKRDMKSHKTIDFAPGFWKIRDPESSSLWIGNYFSSKNTLKKESWRLFFPLYWHDQEKDKSFSYLFPVYLEHKNRDFEWKTTFPLFWKFKTKFSKITVAPPYFSITSFESGEKVSGMALLWTYSRIPKEDWTRFELLGGLLGVEKKADQRKFTLLYLLKI